MPAVWAKKQARAFIIILNKSVMAARPSLPTGPSALFLDRGGAGANNENCLPSPSTGEGKGEGESELLPPHLDPCLPAGRLSHGGERRGFRCYFLRNKESTKEGISARTTFRSDLVHSWEERRKISFLSFLVYRRCGDSHRSRFRPGKASSTASGSWSQDGLAQPLARRSLDAP